MAFGQQKAQRVQTTVINIAQADGWVRLEASSTNNGTNGETTALARRFATKVKFLGKANDRLRLSYDSDVAINDASDELGSGNAIVEPNDESVTLYGRLKSGSGDRARVIIVEYGH